MSFAAVWPALTALQGGGEGLVYESKVLFARRSQSLLVPAGDARRAHAAVAFFVASPLKRWLGHAMLALDRLFPRARLLPLARWENFPVRPLFGAAAGNGAACAVLCGSPGPLQKLTILYPAQDGAPAQVAKVALRSSADETVALEEQWLRDLGAAPDVAPFLPRLRGAGALACGRRYVAMSALPGGDPAFEFGAPHRRFLAALAGEGAPAQPWSRSAGFARLRERLDALAPLLRPSILSLLEGSLNEVDARIGTWRLPTCVAHGDFAPWNVRIEQGRLYVFDWEYAQTGANPLQDYFHFHLMSRLARHRPTTARVLADLLVQARHYTDGVYGTGSPMSKAADALAAQYLLEVITFYAQADGGIKEEHPVLRCYLRLLTERGVWLGAPVGEELQGEVA